MIRGRFYHIDKPEEVYVLEDTVEERIEDLRDTNIAKYRRKTIKSGPMLEMEAYPLHKTPIGKRAKKTKTSSEAQQRLNHRNTSKRVTRIVHTNFKMYKDLIMALSYNDENLPATPEDAHKNMVNLVRRKRHWLKKQDKYKDFELKYIFVTEYNDRPGKEVRIHHHMITNFPDREVLEDLWNKRGRVETNRLQPDEHGVEGLVWYILKQPAGRNTKRYSISRNMEQPKITVADSKITRKRAERLAREEVDAQEVLEKWYPGYKFVDMEIKFSDFSSGAYIYARMKRIEPIQNIRKRE